MLTDEQSLIVRTQIARTLGIDIRRVVPDAKLLIDLEINESQADRIYLAIEEALGVQVRPILDHINTIAVHDDEWQLTKGATQQIIEYLGSWPKQPKRRVSFPVLFTVGMLEAIVAKALSMPDLRDDCDGTPVSVAMESQAVPEQDDGASALPSEFEATASAMEQAIQEFTGIAAAPDWWSSVAERLGPGRFRLLLTGILRDAFAEHRSLTPLVDKCLKVAEKFAETDANWDEREARRRGVESWKLGRNPLWRGLRTILSHSCTVQESLDLLRVIRLALHWDETKMLDEARRWSRSLDAPVGADIKLAPEWVTNEVVSLAQQMHKQRVFTDFPRIGQLMEAAGCDNRIILEHCASVDVRHIRGDWLIGEIQKQTPLRGRQTR